MKLSNLRPDIFLTFSLGCCGFGGSFVDKKVSYKTGSV